MHRPRNQHVALLIVEDDPGIAEMLATFLESHAMTTAIASDGKQALERVASFRPDIILLDIVIPYLDGLTVLNTLRSNHIQTPIILLTEKNSADEKLAGFAHGADDYITKPFSLMELLARVQAILRRSMFMCSNSEQQAISIGDLTVNPVTREVHLQEKAIASLTKTEFDLLYFLAGRKAQAIPHAVLLEKVMGYNPTSRTKALVMHIANIRKKLNYCGVHSVEVQTVPGVGYKLVDNSSPTNLPLSKHQLRPARR